MDYLVKGWLNMGDQAEIPAWLDQERYMKSIEIIRGASFTDAAEPQNLIGIEARFMTVGRCLTFYNKVTALMEQHNIPGTLAWHECRHDVGTPCSYNQTFVWPGGG